MFKELYREIFQSGKYYFFTTIVDRIVSVLFFFVLAKSFSVEDYGRIVTVFAVSNIILTIFDFGLQIYLQRETATKKNIDDVFSAISILKISILFVYYFLVVVYLKSFQPTIPSSEIIIIPAIAFTINYATLLSYLYYGKNRIDIIFHATVITKVTFIFLIFLLLVIHSGLIYFLYALMITALFQVLIMIFKLKDVNVNFQLDFKFLKLGYDIIKISLPLGMAVLFNLLYDKIDIILISKIIGIESVGQYNVAYSIYKLVSIIFSIILIYGFNIFSKNQESKSNFRNLFQLSIPIILVAILFTSLFYFFGDAMLKLLFKNKYILAGNMLPIISFAVLGFGLNSLTGIFINANGRFKGIMLCTGLGLLVNVVFNIIYLPQMGVIAAVYSTILTEYVILFLESIYIYFFIYKS